MIRKYPAFSYFLFTFALSWLFWTIPIFVTIGLYNNDGLKTVYGFGVCSPILISMVLTYILDGKKGLETLLSRCSLKAISIKWYLFSAFLMVIISLLTVFLHHIFFGNPGSLFQWYSFTNYIVTLPIMIIFAVLEEVGWRGFALPKLKKAFSPLVSSLILGLIWGVWHFPKLVSEGMADLGSIAVFEFFVVLVSVFISWIYENTNGNISLAVLTHAAGNAAIYGINKDILLKIGYNKASLIFLILLSIFLLTILILYGTNLSSRKTNRTMDYIP